jgi:hypothetical protein
VVSRIRASVHKYNPGIFPDDLFEPAKTTNREYESEHGQIVSAEDDNLPQSAEIERTPSPEVNRERL